MHSGTFVKGRSHVSAKFQRLRLSTFGLSLWWKVAGTPKSLDDGHIINAVSAHIDLYSSVACGKEVKECGVGFEILRRDKT